MEELVLKTVFKYEGCKLEIVKVGLDKFEIRINGVVKAVEFDYDRACETLESFNH